MALKPYTQDQTLDTGADTLKLGTPNRYIETGLKQLGAGINEFAASQYRATQHDQAQQKLMQGLKESQEFSRIQGIEDQELSIAERNADPSGLGFAESYNQGLNTRLEKYVNGAATPEQQARRIAQAEQLRTAYMKRALVHEDKLITTGLKETQAQTYEDAGAIAAARPDATGYGEAMRRLNDRADLLNMSGRLREAFIREGKAHVARQALLAKAAADPTKLMQAGTDIYHNAPKSVANDVQTKVIVGATEAGFDPLIMLGIGQIESNLNPNVRPIGRDGRPMSSAKGTFQFLDKNPYGNVAPSDTQGQSRQLALFLKEHKERLEAKGIPATPGTLYMYHNVGQGVADRLLASPDDKKMGTILFEVYGNSRFGPGSMYPGELKRDVVARNNPGLYSPNMTVGDVKARYESKMANAMKMHSGVLSQDGVIGTEALRTRLQDVLGFDPEGLTHADLNKAIGIATKEAQRIVKDQKDKEEGYAYLSGQWRASPNDPEQQKKMDTYVRQYEPELYDGFVRGAPEAIARARTMVANTSYIPRPMTEAVREQVHSGAGATQQRSAAFEFAADILRSNQTAHNSAKYDEDTEKRIKLFEANRERMGTRGAIGYVDRYFSDAGKALRKAATSTMNAKDEIKNLKASDFLGAVTGAGFWLNGNVTDREGASSVTANEQFLSDARDAYRRWREDGNTPEEAKRFASEDLKRTWQPSMAFATSTGRVRVMRHAPDKYYAQPVTGMAGFEDQAREIVDADLARRYPGNTETMTVTDQFGNKTEVPGGPGRTSASTEIRVVASKETEEDIRAGRPPRYQLWYRDPKTGAAVLAYQDPSSSLWQPNLDRMQDEDQDAELQDAEAAQRRSRALDDFFGVSPKELGRIIKRNLKGQ